MQLKACTRDYTFKEMCKVENKVPMHPMRDICIVHDKSMTRNLLRGWDPKMCQNIDDCAIQPSIIYIG